MIQFLVHEKADTVAVATVDIKSGEKAAGLFMDTQEKVAVEALKDIPLGHKIALKDHAEGDAVTLWAAGGFVAHLFPTGQGNIIGHPIEPVIKLSANPLTCKTMAEHIDYDCSAILRGEITLEQAGDGLLEMLMRTCNGRVTANEVLGHEEFILTKLYRSA